MSVVYSLYDALVSINVPDAKAKAVIDAMEREMMDKLATKADLAHVKEVLSKDMDRLEERVKAQLAVLETRLTVRLGVMMATMITLATALIGAIQYFS